MDSDNFTALQLINNGNTGNRMFQYAYLRKLQGYLPQSEIFGADILNFVPRSGNYKGFGNLMRIEGGSFYPFDTLAQMIVKNRIRRLRFGGYVQRMEYLGPPDRARQLFSLPQAKDDDRFRSLTSDEHITCVVRADEILKAVHPDYPPTPLAFFRAAVEDSGRKPVLVGQTSSSFYADALRKLLPDCIIYDHIDPIEDFRFISNSTNVAIAVSTFAWMAGYLSDRARRIYMPAFGFLNPQQRDDIDLLPVGDDRYRFARFEPMKWTATDSQVKYVLDPGLPVSFFSR
jgi:hypothetical protein